jgi:hypothetical protein
MTRADHPSVTERPLLVAVKHPRYAFSQLSPELAKKCRCGGILYQHAEPALGCDDCGCTEFDPIEEETNGL